MALLDIKKLSVRERTLLGISGIVIICAASDWAVVQPIRTRISALNREIQAAESQVRRNLEVLARRGPIEEKYNAYAPYIKKSSDSSKTAADMLTAIETCASRANLSMVDRKPQGVVQGMYFAEHTVRVEIEGQLSEMVDFLYNIETTEDLLRVKRIELSPNIRDKHRKTCIIFVSRVVEI